MELTSGSRKSLQGIISVKTTDYIKTSLLLHPFWKQYDLQVTVCSRSFGRLR